MEVTPELVDKLAHLSRLEFDAEARQAIHHDLQRMIAFIEKLGELDTSGVDPLVHMNEEINVLRNDEVRGAISRDEALKNAPVTDGRHFLVPKVIDRS